MKEPVFITTSIPYVNAAPHVGYALEAVQADALTRWHRLIGTDTYFLAGTDENAMKNVESAEKQGITPQELVNKNAAEFLRLKEALGLTFDQFIRTTDPKHVQGAQAFWKLCAQNHPEHIYKKDYQGLYCVGCETFYKDGEFPDNICPLHNRRLETVTETNYFFALSAYAEQVKKLIIADEIRIYPAFRKEEILNFIDKGIEDISISRPTERTKGWGIPVPGDDSQRMYVWFDALTNYITALDFGGDRNLFNTYWEANPNRWHIVGKDIIKFHSLYWPAMLLCAGLSLPTKVYVHGFMTSEGKKISKSLGNVIDPFDLVSTYGIDAVRYYLLAEIPPLDDGDYSHNRMKELYSADLANELGNLVMRLTTLGEKDGLSVSSDTKFADLATDTMSEDMRNYRFDTVLDAIWSKIKELNKSINDFEPWKKQAEERKEFLMQAIGTLHNQAMLLQPFLPGAAEKILSATSGSIRKSEPLFPRLK